MPTHPLLIALEQQRKVSGRPSAPTVDLGALELPELVDPGLPLGVRPPPRPRSSAPRPLETAPFLRLPSLPQELSVWGLVLLSAAFLAVVVVVAFVYYG